MKTILVTGGAGFVGSHACKALARAGYLPVALDNLERGHEWAVKWGPLERVDIRMSKTYNVYFKLGTPKQSSTLPHTLMLVNRTPSHSNITQPI